MRTFRFLAALSVAAALAYAPLADAQKREKFGTDNPTALFWRMDARLSPRHRLDVRRMHQEQRPPQRCRCPRQPLVAARQLPEHRLELRDHARHDEEQDRDR